MACSTHTQLLNWDGIMLVLPGLPHF